MPPTNGTIGWEQALSRRIRWGWGRMHFTTQWQTLFSPSHRLHEGVWKETVVWKEQGWGGRGWGLLAEELEGWVMAPRCASTARAADFSAWESSPCFSLFPFGTGIVTHSAHNARYVVLWNGQGQGATGHGNLIDWSSGFPTWLQIITIPDIKILALGPVWRIIMCYDLIFGICT